MRLATAILFASCLVAMAAPAPIQHNPWTTTTNDPTVTLQAQQPVSITTTNYVALIANGLISTTNDINASLNANSFPGVDPTGASDSTAGLQLAFAVGRMVHFATGTYKISGPLTLLSGTTIDGGRNVVIRQMATNSAVFTGYGVSNVTISGLTLVGTGSTNFFSSQLNGGIAFNSVSQPGSYITLKHLVVSNFFNGISIINTRNVLLYDTRVANWWLYGVLASECSQFLADTFDWGPCDKTAWDATYLYNAYGFSATGDAFGGRPQQNIKLTHGRIHDVVTWDGAMSHDCDGYELDNLVIENVRSGVDIGPMTTNNVIANVLVHDCSITSTTTNASGSNPATHYGIGIGGYIRLLDTNGVPQLPMFPATNVVIAGNVVSGFGTPTPVVYPSGNLNGAISIQAVQNATVSGNTIANLGNSIQPGVSYIGIGVYDAVDNIHIVNNAMSGAAWAGVRVQACEGTNWTIQGNTYLCSNQTNSVGLIMLNSHVTGHSWGNADTCFAHTAIGVTDTNLFTCTFTDMSDAWSQGLNLPAQVPITWPQGTVLQQLYPFGAAMFYTNNSGNTFFYAANTNGIYGGFGIDANDNMRIQMQGGGNLYFGNRAESNIISKFHMELRDHDFIVSNASSNLFDVSDSGTISGSGSATFGFLSATNWSTSTLLLSDGTGHAVSLANSLGVPWNDGSGGIGYTSHPTFVGDGSTVSLAPAVMDNATLLVGLSNSGGSARWSLGTASNGSTNMTVSVNGGSLVLSPSSGWVTTSGNIQSTGGGLYMGNDDVNGAFWRVSGQVVQAVRGDGGDYSPIKGLSLLTSNPSGGTSGTWKLGIPVTGASVSLVTTNYIQVDIGGTAYKLGLVQ